MRGDRHRKDRGEPRFFGQGYQGAHSDAGREARDAHGCHCRGMDWAKTGACAARHSRVGTLREHGWSTRERIALISTLAIVMGALFVTTYSLALGDPVPHRIDAAVVGNPAAHKQTVHAVQTVAGGTLVFRHYSSLPAALRAVDLQRAYTVLDLRSPRPTLYVTSA